MNAWIRALPLLALAVLAFGAVYLAGRDAEVGPSMGEEWTYVLVAMAGALLLLLGALGLEAWRLRRDLAARAPGARMSWRLLKRLALLVLPPLGMLFVFSLHFVHGAVDGWFRVDVAAALDDSLTVAQRSLELAERQALRQLRTHAQRLDEGAADADDAGLAEALDGLQALELALYDRQQRLRARASADPRFLAPAQPQDALWRALRNSGEVSGIDRSGEVLSVLALVDIAGRDEVLLGRFALDNEIATLAQTIEKHYYDYQQLAFLRGALKYTLSVVLSVVLVAAVLFALYLAFALARGLVEPLRQLVEATRAVAQGDYRIAVPELSDDELGGLARAFNQMARELDEANQRLLRAAGDAESGRRYFEGVLDRISSGVLSLDGAGRLRTSNGAAQEILGVDLTPWNGLPIERLGKADPPLLPLVQRLNEALAREPGDWREEVRVQRGPQEQRLLLRGARLPGGDGEVGGLVLVFDDESAYARATRDSAWSEVARRLAHEIKNPLTPIQLAAERLRRKFLERLPEADREVLDRSTHTIVAQVEALKAMVNAFGDYARPPRLELRPIQLSRIVREVVDLYAGEAARMVIRLHLPEDEPAVRADAGRVRQLLHNLLRNAEEAQPEGRAQVDLALYGATDGSRSYFELEVRDHGPGFPESLRDRLFEPYTTTKPKGTGLGLAIVKKIVEEHGGHIRADNMSDGGARFRVRFPL
ncbi:MAG: HAMP domain-containing protein [Xanthomonadales bacterium]|nr:Adaptive-response sensory-kinase SasA [Xanthomonadales bacterium]MCC6594082.1 HAMP domain-containing protein [Xanthomonadales bacterium]MCE7930164.1 HAMP domain-containing protein [Xanthomonadales bacterium PRO6]